MNCIKSKTRNLSLMAALATSAVALCGAYYINAYSMPTMPEQNATEIEVATESISHSSLSSEIRKSTERFNGLIVAAESVDAVADVADTVKNSSNVVAIDHMQMLDDNMDMVTKIYDVFDEYLKEPPKNINLDPADITCVSGLSADQFNELINSIIVYRGLDKSNKLYNTGEAFEYIEDEYGINGIYVLAIFTEESGFATRCINTNNFAGIKGKSGYKSFNTPSDCIYYEGRLLRNSYANYGLTTLSSIGRKYCETSSWANNVGGILNTYLDISEDIV